MNLRKRSLSNGVKKPYVISLGGSLLVPEEIDVNFLKRFRALILGQIKKGRRFIIITGGGKTCRKYQSALKAAAKDSSDEDLDRLGIASTKFNARPVQLLFGRFAHPEIIDDPTKKTATAKKILLAGGWRPGCSTDKDAVLLAKIYGAQTIINLSNINFVYTKDPRKFSDAKKITRISWKNFREIVGRKWSPGANWPFDPSAASLAQKNGQTVIIANGRNFKNLINILEGKKFKGTTIN